MNKHDYTQEIEGNKPNISNDNNSSIQNLQEDLKSINESFDKLSKETNHWIDRVHDQLNKISIHLVDNYADERGKITTSIFDVQYPAKFTLTAQDLKEALITHFMIQENLMNTTFDEKSLIVQEFENIKKKWCDMRVEEKDKEKDLAKESDREPHIW